MLFCGMFLKHSKLIWLWKFVIKYCAIFNTFSIQYIIHLLVCIFFKFFALHSRPQSLDRYWMRRFRNCRRWATPLDAPFQLLLALSFGNGYWMHCFQSCWRWPSWLDAPFQGLLALGCSKGYWMCHLKCCWRWAILLDAPFQLFVNGKQCRC